MRQSVEFEPFGLSLSKGFDKLSPNGNKQLFKLPQEFKLIFRRQSKVRQSYQTRQKNSGDAEFAPNDLKPETPVAKR